MLPVKLTLEGIYSYRERQTIDFTRLTEARLFGIFGPVGSGKSTILEAMIYAIYGTIDRLNNDMKYNVMNLQSDQGARLPCRFLTFYLFHLYFSAAREPAVE